MQGTRWQAREPQRPWEDRSLVDEARALMRLLPRVLGTRVRLLGFELQRAGRDLAGAVVLIAVALFLACTAWAALWVGAAMALRSFDLSWPAVIGLIVVANACGAALALWGMLRLLRHVNLSATVRHLSFADEIEDQPS